MTKRTGEAMIQLPNKAVSVEKVLEQPNYKEEPNFSVGKAEENT